MATQEVNGIRLRQAVKEFGSLQKAIDSLQTQKKTLEASISALTRGIGAKEKVRVKYLDDLNHLDKNIEERKRNLDDLEKAFRKYRQDVDAFIENNRQFLLQYQMVEGFVAMLQTSASTKESVRELAINILMIGGATWQFSDEPSKLRWLFIQTVLGEYLHCYRCDRCETKFIVNKKAQSVITGYHCPNCGFLSSAKPDDSFVEALLSLSKPADANQRQQP
jgi:DNA-directed RNA polymerase subunit RPC12/RpoP/prefoldin subunit 5